MDGHPLNLNLLFRSILLIHSDLFHLLQRHQSLIPNHMPKHRILAIQMRCLVKTYEELAAICTWSLIRHADDTARMVAERGPDLVFKRGLPDGDTAFGLRGGRAGLDHEVRDEAVEERAIVVAGCAEGEEVLGERSQIWGCFKELKGERRS